MCNGCWRLGCGRGIEWVPAVGAAETDPVLGGQLGEAAAVLQMLDHSRRRTRWVKRALVWLCMGA